MKKLYKIIVVALFAITLTTPAFIASNHVDAKFSFSSSRSSSSSSRSGFSFSPSSTRTGTFRSQTQQRNAVLNRTQSSVNSRTTSAFNNQRSYSRPSFFGHNSFLGNIMGGMIGGMISRSLFGGMFGGMGYNSGMYESGPGLFMSSFINIIIMLILLVIVVKIIKKIFSGSRTNNNTPIYNNSNYQPYQQQQNVVEENNSDFENQKIELTKQDAKNYVQNLPISAEEKLSFISKIDRMFSEDEIVNFVENIEKELDSKINISLEEGKNQGIDYVKLQMSWLDDKQKQNLIEKINSATNLSQIEEAIEIFEK